jgi:glucose-6-phosphate 1-dehydrogenase
LRHRRSVDVVGPYGETRHGGIPRQRTTAIAGDTDGASPHEVLLHAAMIGDSMPFTRRDSVEETWRIVQRLLEDTPQVHAYEKGTWGPAAADDLVRDQGGWRGPWMAA